jgi:hypothetical protein
LSLAKRLIGYEFNNFSEDDLDRPSGINLVMFHLLRLLFGSFQRLVRSRSDLLLENLVLRQQLLTLQRRNPRPKLSQFDRTFWVAVRLLWVEMETSSRDRQP